MRSKPNPDGARIRTLRIQRGWTQEQLAEIAGISSRTVQRAETANCASFDTVRAIAVAFETDFDQLLISEACCASDPEPQAVNLPHMPSSGPEIETISVGLPKPQVRRVWVMPLLSTFTLILGLTAGAILNTHFNMGGRSHSLEPSSTAVTSGPAEMQQGPMLPITVERREKPTKKSLSQPRKAVVLNLQAMVAEKLPESRPAVQLPGILITEDPGSRDIIQHSQDSASLDLPLSSHTLLSELVIPEVSFAFNEFSVLSGDSTMDEPDLGAVRQAMDVAAKKTGAAVSKIGISLKRVF
jgi:transcriptional regulator with XRE-family HTH domain